MPKVRHGFGNKKIILADNLTLSAALKHGRIHVRVSYTAQRQKMSGSLQSPVECIDNAERIRLRGEKHAPSKVESNMKTNRISSGLCIATAILAASAITAFSADAGGKATPPYVWAHVATKQQADAVKPGDQIAMVCAKCKTVSVTLVTQDTKTKTKLIPGEKHLCAGCKSTITVVGSKAHNQDLIKHVCQACGDDSAFCCATTKTAEATKGMEKK